MVSKAALDVYYPAYLQAPGFHRSLYSVPLRMEEIEICGPVLSVGLPYLLLDKLWDGEGR